MKEIIRIEHYDSNFKIVTYSDGSVELTKINDLIRNLFEENKELRDKIRELQKLKI